MCPVPQNLRILMLPDSFATTCPAITVRIPGAVQLPHGPQAGDICGAAPPERASGVWSQWHPSQAGTTTATSFIQLIFTS